MPNLAKLSLGAVILSKRGNASVIARELRAKVRTVASWLEGARLPGDDARKVIQKKYPEVAVSSWDHPAMDPPKPKRSELLAKIEAARPPPSATMPLDGEEIVPPPRDVRSVAERLLTHVQAELARVERDPTMSPETRTKVYRELSATLAKAAKFTGDALEISEAKILRSPAWEPIRRAIAAALEPYPEAMKAVVEALDNASAR